MTPWLASAIEENFGSSHRVEVGGTQIERTENGGTAVRIRDIVVRDADGTVVASAPKAEVRVSGLSLLSGHMRAESLNLVGAEMAVRIEQDGGVTDLCRRQQAPDRDRFGAGYRRRCTAALRTGKTQKLTALRQPRREARRLGSRQATPAADVAARRRRAAPAMSLPRCCPGSMASAKPASTAMTCASSGSRTAT